LNDPFPIGPLLDVQKQYGPALLLVSGWTKEVAASIALPELLACAS